MSRKIQEKKIVWWVKRQTDSVDRDILQMWKAFKHIYFYFVLNDWKHNPVEKHRGRMILLSHLVVIKSHYLQRGWSRRKKFLQIYLLYEEDEDEEGDDRHDNHIDGGLFRQRRLF